MGSSLLYGMNGSKRGTRAGGGKGLTWVPTRDESVFWVGTDLPREKAVAVDRVSWGGGGVVEWSTLVGADGMVKGTQLHLQ